MSATESERLALHEQLAEKIGPEPAGTLMNQLPRVDSDELATKTDLRQFGDRLRAEMSGLKSELRGEMRGLQGEMKELRAEMLGELTGLRGEMLGELTGLRGELTGLRGELEKRFAAMEVRLAEQSRELSDKLSSQSRTTTLVVVAMALSVWVAMLVPLLINNSA